MEISWVYTLLSLFLLLIASRVFTTRKQKLPPSPWPAIPLLGHLYLLKPPLHQTLHRISEKLGPIFSLRFGNRLIVVISSPALVDECYTRNDIVLANRPRVLGAKYIGYNYTTLVSSPYGDHWRNLRRLTTVEVFSTARLNKFASERQDEVKIQLQKLYSYSGQDFARVELRRVFSEITFNHIMRMVAGKRYFGEREENKEAKLFRELINEVLRRGGVSHASDFFPVLRWIDYKGYQKSWERLFGKMDAFIQSLIEEQRNHNSADTMIGHLLSLQESEPEYYSDTIIRGIIMVMLIAGTDTSAVTLEWAMSALLNNPDKLEKAKAEVDNVIGNDRLINESDLSHLPYLEHIISETMRLFPATPLLVPHESSSDCKIGGYDIPKGTILLMNAWTIHKDPMIWDDPKSFKPERFEAGEVGPPKLIPFGMGRRSCPGNGLALRVVGLALGSLIQCFEWQRINQAKVDLTEGSGLSMPKAIPLQARCKARDVLHKVLTAAA